MNNITIENKHTFRNRLFPYFGPSDQLDIQLAYCLAKFGHRAQTRKELTEGKPTRYFEHVRRVAIVLMDELSIMDRDMIITCLLHDSIEDCQDLSPELLEHSFGNQVVALVKWLSKVPKEGYIERLNNCHEWKVLIIKACDRLDNLRSLMGNTSIDFQKKQIAETKDKYFAIFDKMVTITPEHHKKAAIYVRDEIRRLVERYSTIIELNETQTSTI